MVNKTYFHLNNIITTLLSSPHKPPLVKISNGSISLLESLCRKRSTRDYKTFISDKDITPNFGTVFNQIIRKECTEIVNNNNHFQ